MTKDQALLLLRQTLLVLGGILVGRGALQQSEVEAIATLATIVAPVAWALWTLVRRKKAAAVDVHTALLMTPPPTDPGVASAVARVKQEVVANNLTPESVKPFEAAAAEVGSALAAAFDNPETIIRKLAEWARTNYPERVAQAYWFSLSGDRDKGFQIEVMRLPWTFRDRIRLSIGALVGAKTVGGSIFANVWQSQDAKWVLSVGVGAVTDYGSLMSRPQWELVGTVALKVKF